MSGEGRKSAKQKDKGKLQPLRACECIEATSQLGPGRSLFGDFWQEGDLTLLFGPTGVGKSVLAVQIAEDVANGTGVVGFDMTSRRRRVLYVDMRLSDRYFHKRYTDKDGAATIRFSRNLFRMRPPANRDLIEWLSETVRAGHYRTIVIDDLSAVSTTADGTRELLKLMHKLRALKEELGLSILVLAGSKEAGRDGLVREADLGRRRVLCDAADTVFALGWHRSGAGKRYLVQTRSPGAAVRWNERNAPVGTLEKIHGVMLGFVFDERLRAGFDREITWVKAFKDAGFTYRDIEETFGIPKSTAWSMEKRWRPWMGPGPRIPPKYPAGPIDISIPPVYDPSAYVDDDKDEDADAVPVYYAVDGGDEDRYDAGNDESDQVPPEPEPEPEPEPPEPPEPRTPREILLAHGCEPDFDPNGRDIYVESRYENGRPKIWYRFLKKDSRSPADILQRVKYDGSGGIYPKRVDGPICSRDEPRPKRGP